MKTPSRHKWIVVCSALVLAISSAAAPAAEHVDNLIVVTIDGLRWQEVFGGADATMLATKSKAVFNPTLLRTQYLRPDKEAQRERLMPFLWTVVAKKGQIFGDRESNSIAQTANPHHFSYPGYSELFCGFVEPKIDSNDDIPNPNKTIFEWLNEKPAFAGKIATFGSWDRLHAIINPERSGIFCMAGWRPIPEMKDVEPSPVQALVGDMRKHATEVSADEPPDVFCETVALDYLKRYHPRVLYVMLGEPDHWGHMNDYSLYLDSTNRSDDFIKRIWELAQSLPQYAGKTGASTHLRSWTWKWTRMDIARR